MVLLQRQKGFSQFECVRYVFYHSSVSPLSLEECLPEQLQQQPDSLISLGNTLPKTKTKTSRTISKLIIAQPWSSQLESSLISFSPTLSTTTVIEILDYVRPTSKTLLFFRWANDIGFKHNGDTYFKMLEILSRSRNLNAARDLLFEMRRSGVKLEDRFFNSLIRSYGRAGLLQESIKVFKKMEEFGVSPSVFSFNNLFAILLRRGRTNMVKKYYDTMLNNHVAPDVYTFNILIRGFCLNSMVNEGFRFFKEMVRVGCSPDIVTYNTLLDGLCRFGKVENAHNLLRGMRRKNQELLPNVVSYTTLIRGYCENRLIPEALEIFDEMVDQGLKPNKITYNTLIQGLCEAKKLDKIKEILQGIMDSGEFKPDTCTFNTLMNAHCNAGKLDDAMMMFTKMLQLDVKPDSATYSILIRNLCVKGDFQKAEELLDELLEKEILLLPGGCLPLVAAYNPIFEYLCVSGKTEKADKTFRQLLKRGTPDPTSYKTLILGYCKDGAPQAGYDILVLMLRNDYLPDMEIYNSLIERFMKKEKPDFAFKTLDKMLKSNHLPRTSTFHLILGALLAKGHTRVAASAIKMMIERKIRQNLNLATDSVVALFGSALSDLAYEIIHLLYDNGYSVKMETLLSFLCQNHKFIEAQQLLLFSLEKHCDLNIEIYSRVITGLCQIKRSHEAFTLFYEMIEKGKQPISCSLEDLANSLKVEGRSREADFVSKRMMERPIC